MNSVVSQMDAIRSTVTHLAETIDSLSRHSKEIVEITNDISDISAQTNMLSLNAAIEAARAGEQGRGFAVVSDSVRKLAVQTKDSTEKITAIVNAIVASMELAATNMTSAFKEVEDGAGLVHRAGEEFERIQAASMDTANHAEAVSEAVDRISQGAGQIVESIRIALQHAGRTVDGAQGVSAATEEQLATMQEISASANMLSHMAEELHTLIDRFRM